jgi:hypothetical protein
MFFSLFPEVLFMSTALRVLLVAVLLLMVSTAFGQQAYVSRFDAYAGYAFLDSPHVNLFENGFSAQFGVRPKSWYSLGIDYTWARGDLNLTPDMLTTEIQQSLGAKLGQLAAAGLLPPGYKLAVPSKSTSQTFAVGPQLAYRRMRHATLFLRPVFAGLIYEVATPAPPAGDLIAAGIVKSLAPDGKKTNTTWFLGFGGGFDVIFSKHVSWRVQADLVYDHLFNDLLKDGRFTTRFALGPAFNFGRNIRE